RARLQNLHDRKRRIDARPEAYPPTIPRAARLAQQVVEFIYRRPCDLLHAVRSSDPHGHVLRLGRLWDAPGERRGRRCVVLNFSCSVAEILDHEHTHRAGATACVACRLDLTHQAVEIPPFPLADLAKRVPQLWLQPHAGPAAPSNDVAVHQSTALHVRSHLLKISTCCGGLLTCTNPGRDT